MRFPHAPTCTTSSSARVETVKVSLCLRGPRSSITSSTVSSDLANSAALAASLGGRSAASTSNGGRRTVSSYRVPLPVVGRSAGTVQNVLSGMRPTVAA